MRGAARPSQPGSDRPRGPPPQRDVQPHRRKLEQLEFNLLWHHALRLDRGDPPAPEDPPQLPSSPDAARPFQETTDRIIQALGIRTGKQRLDSTHIMSNIAITRLGLFCETMRLFLRALRWEHPELRPGVPEGLLGRYLKEEDEATHYEDARHAFRSVPGTSTG